MSIPIDVHYEVQYATSNRAKCKLCGNSVARGSTVIKVLGFRINHTIHPECIEHFVSILTLAKDVSSNPPATVRSSGDGVIKIGVYEKRQIDYVNRAIERMDGLRSKSAWKSFLFLRGELKKLMRTWREQVDHPDTPENKRLYFLGCIYGAKVIFQISQNFIQMKKEIETGNTHNVLKFFQRKGK